jgi:hypothetical protein
MSTWSQDILIDKVGDIIPRVPMNNGEGNWKILDQFLKICNPWFTLYGEHLQNENDELLHYWRIEKADSVIILPILNDFFILPHPMYRPGIGEATLDFPGGRIIKDLLPEDAARKILQRELGLASKYITAFEPLNHLGWAINSSFSNQRLFAFIATIDDTFDSSQQTEILKYPANTEGFLMLLNKLSCLQCRAVLLEWYIKKSMRKMN